MYTLMTPFYLKCQMSSICFLGRSQVTPGSASYFPRIYVSSLVIGLQGGLRLDTQMHEHPGVPQHQWGKPSPLGQLTFRVSLPLWLADMPDSFPYCSVLTHTHAHTSSVRKKRNVFWNFLNFQGTSPVMLWKVVIVLSFTSCLQWMSLWACWEQNP